jgi:kynurenine 3-monooxygenase
MDDVRSDFEFKTSDRQGEDPRAVSVIGAGPAGTLISILLAQRGYNVTAYERLPDLRHSATSAGRSINLALAERGINALKRAGVYASIEPLMIPMRGRMLHDAQGKQTLMPYGQGAHEVIYSISRNGLNGALLNFAERTHNVQLRFRQTCIAVDAKLGALCMQDLPTGRLYGLPLQKTIAADGAGSVLRRFLTEHGGATCTEAMLAHGYKEITLPATDRGTHRLDPNALHVWPRGDFMLIALPNLDGSFTATLFLPHDGPVSFSALRSPEDVTAFFTEHFQDISNGSPDIAAQYFDRPTGSMGTVRCDRWNLDDRLVLIGDAAHAIVPFHGQGMNCAFEDCAEFAALLDAQSDWRGVSERFVHKRKPDTDAIADMALENYVEMRDTVRHPKFQLQRELSLELERRFPNRFVPRYSMVMFRHDIPYTSAYERGAVQAQILTELTEHAQSIGDIEFGAARTLIEKRLSPLQ